MSGPTPSQGRKSAVHCLEIRIVLKQFSRGKQTSIRGTVLRNILADTGGIQCEATTWGLFVGGVGVEGHSGVGVADKDLQLHVDVLGNILYVQNPSLPASNTRLSPLFPSIFSCLPYYAWAVIHCTVAALQLQGGAAESLPQYG